MRYSKSHATVWLCQTTHGQAGGNLRSGPAHRLRRLVARTSRLIATTYRGTLRRGVMYPNPPWTPSWLLKRGWRAGHTLRALHSSCHVTHGRPCLGPWGHYTTHCRGEVGGPPQAARPHHG